MRLADGINAVFTDRLGGVSAEPYDSRNLGGAVGDDPEAVARNREKTAAELGVGQVVFMRQVHGTDTRYVTEPFIDDGPELDAVCTDRPGLALAVLVADCVPVLIADPQAGLIGAAHSGRAGTAAGVVPMLLETMCTRGGRPSRMVAVVGPAACAGCYEVSEELRDEVADVRPETYATTRKGTPGLDLRAGVSAQLASFDVGEVRHDDRCTIESPELYSYRRDRTTGRFAGYIWRDPA